MAMLSHWQQCIASLYQQYLLKNQCLLYPKSLPDTPALEETKQPGFLKRKIRARNSCSVRYGFTI